jgi:hypothetical protein
VRVELEIVRLGEAGVAAHQRTGARVLCEQQIAGSNPAAPTGGRPRTPGSFSFSVVGLCVLRSGYGRVLEAAGFRRALCDRAIGYPRRTLIEEHDGMMSGAKGRPLTCST